MCDESKEKIDDCADSSWVRLILVSKLSIEGRREAVPIVTKINVYQGY